MARLSVRELASREFTPTFLQDVGGLLTLAQCSASVSSTKTKTVMELGCMVK